MCTRSVARCQTTDGKKLLLRAAPRLRPGRWLQRPGVSPRGFLRILGVRGWCSRDGEQRGGGADLSCRADKLPRVFPPLGSASKRPSKDTLIELAEAFVFNDAVFTSTAFAPGQRLWVHDGVPEWKIPGFGPRRRVATASLPAVPRHALGRRRRPPPYRASLRVKQSRPTVTCHVIAVAAVGGEFWGFSTPDGVFWLVDTGANLGTPFNTFMRKLLCNNLGPGNVNGKLVRDFVDIVTVICRVRATSSAGAHGARV